VAALLLCAGLFAFWLALGYAVTSICLPRRRSLHHLLLAPAVGLATTVLGTFLLNRAGCPVARFGWPLTAGLLVVTGVALWYRRPGFPARRYAPFAAVFIAALLLTGRPFLEFGFDWLSYCNDDMANYSLAASRVLRHGFYDFPTADDLFSGRDFSHYFWFFHVSGGIRCGAEMVVAWTSSLTGLTVHQAFMPVVVALQLVLVSSVGALAGLGRRPRRTAFWACTLAAMSSLLTYGVLYQLIAQVGGLALLCAAAALLRPTGRRAGRLPGRGLLLGLAGAAQLVFYPEVVPLLGGAFALQVMVLAWRRPRALPRMFGLTAVAALASLALVRGYCVDSVRFVLHQVQHGVSAACPDIFPYYLLPSGLASLWGLQPLVPTAGEPWLSVWIAVGGALVVAAAVACLALAARAAPIGLLGVVCFLSGGFLLRHTAAFGLFKLAMYCQPFLLGALAAVCCGPARGRRARLASALPLAALAAAGLPAQDRYVQASRDLGNTAEVWNASRNRIIASFRELVAARPGRTWLIDTCGQSLMKFESEYTRGAPVYFPNESFLALMFCPYADNSRDGRVREVVHDLRRQAPGCVREEDFDVHDPAAPGAVNRFRMNLVGCPSAGPTGCDYLVTLDRQTVFNARRYRGFGQQFLAVPMEEVHDHLLFVSSDLGLAYDAQANRGGKGAVAYYQPERSLWRAGEIMQSVGGHLLFEVLRPSPGMRLELELSATLNADRDNRLPPAAAIGGERLPLPVRGRGSCRVFSPPLVPQKIDGRWYVAIDMGSRSVQFRDRRGGLMALWGSNLHFDRRRLVGFARDISLVSEQEYARLAPPAALEVFPRDLRHPDLEYSGIYEDGWLSEDAFCVLAHAGGPTELVVRGLLPQLSAAPTARRELVVSVDGTEVVRRQLSAGEFQCRCEVDGPPGRRRVELRFSGSENLPGSDGRPVAAQLRHVGFAARPEATTATARLRSRTDAP
jgi:hypothetical protein